MRTVLDAKGSAMDLQIVESPSGIRDGQRQLVRIFREKQDYAGSHSIGTVVGPTGEARTYWNDREQVLAEAGTQ